MELFTYYQIYYISNVTKRKHNMDICIKSEEQAKLLVSVLTAHTKENKFGYSKVTKKIYYSVEDYAKLCNFTELEK